MIDFLSDRDTVTGIFVAGALGALVWVVLYGARSRGWMRSDVGRNLMAFMAVLLGLLGLVVAARFWGPFPRWIWSCGVALLDAVIWWRVIILIRKQHQDRSRS